MGRVLASSSGLLGALGGLLGVLDASWERLGRVLGPLGQAYEKDLEKISDKIETHKLESLENIVEQEGLFDVTVEMTVIDTSVQKGTIWKIKCSQEFEETSKTRTQKNRNFLRFRNSVFRHF